VVNISAVNQLGIVKTAAGEVIGSLPLNPVTAVEVTRRLAMLPAMDVEVIATLATTTPSAGL